MSIVYISHAKPADWEALHACHEQILLARAHESGARRYGLYRSTNDARELLLIAEFAHGDQLRVFLAAWFDAGEELFAARAEDAQWEPLGWGTIP